MSYNEIQRFQCGICPASRKNYGDLKKHEKLHMEPREKKKTSLQDFKCLICEKVFRTKSNIKKHILSVHEKLRNFKCHLCENAYLDSSALNFHLERHKTPEEEHIQCDICSKMINKFNFKRHKIIHKENPKNIRPKRVFECPRCDKVFGEKGHLNKHISAVHDKLRKFKCHLCDSTFTDSTPLRVHLKRHKADRVNKQFKCTFCDKSFKIDDELRVHVKHIHTHPELYREKCNICGKELNLESMKYHMNAVHSTKDIECPECDATFAIERLLTEHMERLHNPDRQRKYKCEECGKSFFHPGDLRNHKRYIHNPKDNKKYYCKPCDKSFVQPGGLYIHNQSMHEDKQFKCDDCGKTFGLKVILTRHMYRHTGVKPFKCEQIKCEFSFQSPSALKKHSLMHAEGYPFRCPTCNLGFNQNRLISHFKTFPTHELAKG